jgi:hypothetical protein
MKGCQRKERIRIGRTYEKKNEKQKYEKYGVERWEKRKKKRKRKITEMMKRMR